MNEHMNTDNNGDLEIKSSIRWKLVIAMSIMIVAIVSSLTMLLISNEKTVFEKHLSSQTDFLKEQMNIKADKISDVMVSQLHRLLVETLPENQGNDEVRQYIRNYVHDIDSLRYVILMKGGNLFFAKGIKLSREMKNSILRGHVAEFALSQFSPAKHDFELDNIAFRETIVPFKVIGKPWVLRLGFPLGELNMAIAETRETIDKEVRSAFIQATLTAILFIVLGGIAVFFLANRWTRRIRELVNFSHELAGGNFSATPHISVRTNDEVGVLVSSLEEMAASLRRSYAQLEEHSHTLEDKVDKRTRQLAEARDNALAATRAKSEFLANMSHEIRTPMNAIIGLTHLALDRETNSKQRDYLSKVHSAAKSLLGIINDILDVSKVEAGKLDMEMVEFELEQVLNNLSSVSWDGADEKGLELIFDFPSDIPVLIGDPLRLGQVLLNLTTNAIKFTEEGKVNVTTEMLEQNDNEVQLRFSVTDTGIGISDEQQVKLFQSFTQADASTTRKYGGTGLGLSISKQLVELMGGELIVESSVDMGSAFSFSIRFATARQRTGRGLAVPDEIRGLRVIIADYNASSRDILDKCLTRFGFETFQLASAAEVLSALRDAPEDKPFQLVLISWKLPDMNGIEAASKIISAGLKLTPKQILVTAYGRDELQTKAERAGMDGFLVKPVSPSTLLESIQGVFHLDNEFTCIEEKSGETSLEPLANFDGTHLLVAEDNEINRQVAEGLLSRVGISMRFVNNGEEAIAVMLEEAFDGVLMDMQMPVMGGLEATRKIRENDRFKDIPIIAMTANVMQGDRERCIQSGMNDFIAKPIDPEMMYSTLKQWIKPTQGSMTTAMPAGDHTKHKEFFMPEIDGLDTQKGLKTVDGDQNLYRKILWKFRENQSAAVSQLRDALAEGDTELGERLAHSMKSVAGTIGAVSVSDSAGKLEIAIRKGGEVDQILIDKLNEVHSKVIKGLQDYFGTDEEQEETDISPDPVVAMDLIRQLREGLEGYDSDAVNLMDKLKPALAGSVVSKQVKALQSHLDAYDFDAALEALQQVEKIIEEVPKT